MANSFYKTTHEKIVSMVVDRFYNDEIGGRENHYLDTHEMMPITEEDLVELITKEITSCKTTLWTESGWGLEAKHIRFIGKERIKEIVAHRVAYRHNKEGNWVWENEQAD